MAQERSYPRAAGEDFFTSRMARDLRVFPYGRNIAAVVSAVGGQISPGSTKRVKDLTKGPRAQ
jgi:hypothetical protein